jgi:phthiodiolone/phenolphthiodiolone dimycocerosates ketoreductase
MPEMTVTTALPFDRHRATPTNAIPGFAAALRQAGIDFGLHVDELNNVVPDPLWRPDYVPIAAIRDAHSTHDPFLLAAMQLAADPTVGVRITTDAIRSRPAELMRSMMTLADSTRGDAEAICALGVGEVRQIRPWGGRRGEGLARYEDLLRLTHLLWERDEPFDFDGNIWKLTNATLGRTRGKRPKFWALGGGPKLIEIAAKYADGFETGSPSVIVTPEQWSDRVASIRETVERAGRDPDAFGFGVWLVSAIHEDPKVIDRALENPLVKGFAALFGRFQPADWRNEGLEPAVPAGFHYALHWTPTMQTPAEVDAMIARVPDEMVQRSVHRGSPTELAARAQQFIEAGATHIAIYDLLPVVLDPAEHPAAFARNLEVCARLHHTSTMSTAT